MKRIQLLFFLFFLVSIDGFSDTTSQIDSLNKRIDHYLKADSMQQVLTALHDLSNIYELLGDWHHYDSIVDEMIRYSYQIDDKGRINECYNKLGIACCLRGDNKKALEYFEKTMEISFELQDSDRISNSYENIGMVYKDMGYYEKAVSYQLESAKIRKKTGYSRLFNNYTGLAILYGLLKDDDKQDEYIQLAKSVLFKAETKDYAQWAIFYNEVADIYDDRGLIDSTVACYKKVIECSRKIDWQRGIMIGLGNLAGTYMDMEQYPKAIELHKQSLDISLKIDDCMSIAEEYLYLADLYVKTNKLVLALQMNNKSLEYARKCNLRKELANSYLLQSDIYSRLKNYKKAYEFHLAFYELNDSLSGVENKQNIAEIETRFQTREKEQKIELLNAQNLSEKREKNAMMLIFIAIAVILVLVAVTFIHLSRNHRKTARELKKLGELKSRFFGNVSHELRTPLTLIDGPVNDLLSKEDNGQKRVYLNLIKQNSSKLLENVNQLLDLSKIDAGHFELSVAKSDLSLFMGHITAGFDHLAGLNKIDYSKHFEVTEDSWFDAKVLETILINLLSNAFKYVDDRNIVAFNALQSGDVVKISVVNSCDPISYESLQKLFDRFYRGHDAEMGTGIGLSLVKELINVYRAKITATYNTDNCMQIDIELPVGKSHFKPSEISHQKQQLNIVERPVSVPSEEFKDFETNKEDSPTILVVEDNNDMRFYIASCFENNFRVLQASDGQEGFDKALEEIPDIILTDRMMPKMDGITLCSRLKNEKSTSHIPVIMLTALAGEENIMEGLVHKADEYITKPFNTEVLLLKVRNMIEQSLRMRDKYSRELLIKPLNLILPSSEEQFAMDLQKILNDHITNPEFNVEQFCAETNMSRAQLHRKLTSLTGHSATSFIRSQRVKMAAELLKSKNSNVADVCYSVGFNDTSYFSKCFKEVVGDTPKVYQLQMSEN